MIPSEDSFVSSLRSERVSARLGVAVGVCFGLCFLTGIYSHNQYLHHPWLPLLTRPVWIYRVTQGVHVLSGTAAIPLLLVKLWSVYPKLFARPPRDLRALMLEGAERGSIAVLVAAAVTELAIGVMNISQWYPWHFSFRATHYALAWVAVGAMLVHIAVKVPVIRRAFAPEPVRAIPAPGAPSRRLLLGSAGVASGLAVLGSAGIAVPGLRHLSVLGVRSGAGPEDLPITRSARAAGVTATALHPAWTLEVRADGRTRSFSRTDLEALPQRSHVLPIACVEGWSKDARWTGVRLRDLLDASGAGAGHTVRFVSLQTHGAFGVSELPRSFADDPLTLIALRLNGEALSIDHGYPCRLVAPGRPGVFQTKWLQRIEVL